MKLNGVKAQGQRQVLESLRIRMIDKHANDADERRQTFDDSRCATLGSIQRGLFS